MIEVILGKRGSGKSTLARSLLLSRSRVIVIDPLEEYYGDRVFNLADLHVYCESRVDFMVRFIPQGEWQIDYVYALALTYRNVCIVHDEFDMVSNPGYAAQHLSNCIRRGRHYNVDLIAISRRPAEVPRLLTSQANRFYIFRFSEPADLDYFKRTFSADIIEELQSLPEHGYIVREL